MTRKKQRPDSVTTTGQGNYEKHVKDSNFGLQLQFSWYNQPLQESPQKAHEKDSQVSNRRDSLQLDIADQKMQKITEGRDKKAEPGTQTELPFMEAKPPLPPVIDPPAALMPDDEGNSIRELPVCFEGKGDVSGIKFTQLKRSEYAYVYQVQKCGPIYYEIFERRVNTRFRNVTYPSNEAFSVSATTTCDLQKAMEIFDELNCRRAAPCV